VETLTVVKTFLIVVGALALVTINLIPSTDFVAMTRHAMVVVSSQYGVTVAIIVVASSISGIAGFAFSPLAGSILFHVVTDSIFAIKILLVSSIATQVTSAISIRRAIEWPSVYPFILGGMITILPGIYLLVHVSPKVYLQFIGVLLIMYGICMLFRNPIVVELNGRWAWFVDLCVGSVGGITAPLAAAPGPFVIAWCGMRGWDKLRQRAIYQPYILAMQISSLSLIAFVTGSDTYDATLSLYALPAVLGTLVGIKVFRSLTSAQVTTVVNLFLVCSGIVLVVNSGQSDVR
jgi:uncharacterized membrane protein YfcA